MADAPDPWSVLRPLGAPRSPEPSLPPEPLQGAAAADPWAVLKPAAPAPAVAAEVPNADGTYGQPPEGFAYNPQTGQMEDLRSPINPNIPTGRGNAAAIGLGQGVGFGGLDETVGGILGLLQGEDQGDYGREVMREAERRAQENNPGGYYPGVIGGSVLGALGVGKLAGAALGTASGPIANAARYGAGVSPTAGAAIPSLGARTAAGATAGAVDGALYGFGAGEGGAGERLDSAAGGAIAGGVAGGAFPVVQAALGPLVRGVGNVVAAPFRTGADETAAGRTISRAMDRAGVSEEDILDAITGARADGQPMYTITDAIGSPAQRALNGIARQPGAASVQIEDILMQRQAGQGERLSGFVTDALGVSDTAAQREAALRAARGSAADANYAAARQGAGPVDLTPAINTIDALTKRDPLIGDSGLRDTEIGRRLRQLREGMTTGRAQLIDFDTVLNLKEDLGRTMQGLQRSGRAVPPQLVEASNALDAALEAASAGYRTANDEFAAGSRVIDAVSSGSQAASGRARAPNTIEEYLALNPLQQDAFRTGYADPLLARIDNAPFGVNKARPFTSEKIGSEFGAMSTDPDLFGRRITRENTMHRTMNRATGGSQTVSNDLDVSDAARGAAGFVGETLVNPLAATRRFAGGLARGALNGVTGQNDLTREAIARGLLSDDLEAALRPYQEAARRATGREAAVGAAQRGVAARLMSGGQ